jgi:hypothetical protein
VVWSVLAGSGDPLRAERPLPKGVENLVELDGAKVPAASLAGTSGASRFALPSAGATDGLTGSAGWLRSTITPNGWRADYRQLVNGEMSTAASSTASPVATTDSATA